MSKILSIDELDEYPQDVLENILSNLDYNEILRYCSLSKKSLFLCSKISFWQTLAEKNYDVTASLFNKYMKVGQHPAERYLEILTSYGDVTRGSEKYENTTELLRRAVELHDKDLIQYFIENGAYFNGEVYNAIVNNDIELLKLILEAGKNYIDINEIDLADINIIDFTIFKLLIEYGLYESEALEIVFYNHYANLIEDLHSDYESVALEIDFHNSYEKLIEDLIDNGADINYALYLAADTDNNDIAINLIRRGAKLSEILDIHKNKVLSM